MDSSAHRTSILILTHSLRRETCCCFAPVASLFGGSEFNLGGSDRTGFSQQRFQGSEVPRFFSEVPDFEFLTVTVLDLGVFIPLGPPTVTASFSPN